MPPQADILIVTMTKVESRAVIAAFEQETGRRAVTISIGDRVYRACDGPGPCPVRVGPTKGFRMPVARW